MKLDPTGSSIWCSYNYENNVYFLFVDKNLFVVGNFNI